MTIYCLLDAKFAAMCEEMAQAFSDNRFEVALHILSQLRTLIAESQYPEDVPYPSYVSEY